MSMNERELSICVYSLNYSSSYPLASVRFTKYGEDGLVEEVEQVDYWEEDYWNRHVENAIDHGFDVAVLTRMDSNIMKKRVKQWSAN